MSVSDHDRRFLSQLARLPEPTISSLCEATGVTATAVRHRLNRLLDGELIEKQSIVRGRGRPANYYQLTSAGRNALGDNSTRLAELLWREVMRIESDEIRGQVIDGVRRSLAEDLSEGIGAETPAERLAELGGRLQSTGFDVAVTVAAHDGAAPTLQEHCCPYHSVVGDESATNRDICRFEEQVFSEVVGAPVRISQHCGDGHSCCEFELVELSGSGSIVNAAGSAVEVAPGPHSEEDE